jgi:hypothetical protein
MRPESRRVCRTCGRLSPRYLHHGECDACAVYRRKYGRTRPYGPVDGRTVADARGPESPGVAAAGEPLRGGPRPPRPCAVCGRPAKPLRRGRCHACDEYFRRRGVERSAPVSLPVALDA